MNAQELTAALGGRWHGSYGTARCPAHEDRNPSLQISDGETAVLLKCHAGCENRGIIEVIKSRGLWGGESRDFRCAPKFVAPQKRGPSEDELRRTRFAQLLWERAVAPQGTLVERYRDSRGLSVDIPDTIRHLPSAKHADTGLFLPCMLAAVQRWPSQEVVAVHRTYLKTDGSGKAGVSSQKKMLGPVSGGAVRLAPHGSTLVISEGIETGLTVLQETGKPVWAALSKGGIERLILPAEVTEVIIAADNDAPGLEAAKKAAQRWTVEGRKVRIAKPPVEGWDFNDQLLAKNVALFPGRRPMDEVRTVPDSIGDAPEYRESLDAAVMRLAALTRGEYEQCRKAEAKRLGVRPKYIDDAVKDARDDGEDSGGFKLYEPDPWDEEVDGDDLLDRITAVIRMYVIVPEHVAETAALWVVHTHAFDLWQVTPRLAISAPTMGSGKSVMLDVLGCLVPRPLEADNLSTAVMFRAVDKYRPTLMVDEVDTFLRDNDELRGMLNSGYRKGGQAFRCEGDNNDIKAFSTFAPIATAGIGKLPGTLADRSVHAELQRKRPDEHVQSFRGDRIDNLRDLARQAARWVIDNRGTLREAEPEMPGGIFNRKADNWRPLLAIADIAGGDWPARARMAAVALSGSDVTDAESFKVQLLADTHNIFEDIFEDRLSTKDLLSRLQELEDRPWSDFRRGKPISARHLGDMLRSFKILPTTIRFSDNKVAKGYKKSSFENAFARYLPDFAVTPLQVNETAGFSGSHAVTSGCNVTAQNAENPKVSPGCNGVTAENPGKGETRALEAENWEAEL